MKKKIISKMPPKINPKRMPLKVNPKNLTFPKGTWVELTETDRSFDCARAGKLGEVMSYAGSGVYNLILKCGHPYQSSKVRKIDEPRSNSIEMRVLRMGRGRRNTAAG